VTKPFCLDLADGDRVVGDEQPGTSPSYVFLHGLGSTRHGEKSAALLEHASARGRGFVRFDMRGHGESSGELGRVRIRQLIEDAVLILERTGPAVVVGSSLGGLVAAHVAGARPDLVERLALLAPAFGLMPSLSKRLDERGFLVLNDGPLFHVAADVCADAEALDEAALPTRIQTPTLVVHGTEDDVIPQRASEWFFDALAAREKQLWLVAGGDHRLNDVAADIWARVDALGGGAER